MACFHPLDAIRIVDMLDHSSQIVFQPPRRVGKYHRTEKLQLPCGRCVGCRLERSRQWAVRCMHEASLYQDNIFITLTYDDHNLPADRSLDLRHFQLFMKKLRKKYGPNIRFYHCGEYGEQFGRPHYHACLFNFKFPDQTHWETTKRGDKIFRSKSLEELWPYGMSNIGSVTFESAGYVARYIMKKILGDEAQDHYVWIDPATGQIHNRKPEYTTMSRRPGIAYDWFKKYHTDVYPSDEVIVKGRAMRPPKFYDYLYELQAPSDYAEIKDARENRAFERAQASPIDNNSPERLNVREQVVLSKITSLKRKLK